MSLRYEYINRPKTSEQAVTFIDKILLPFLAEYWVKRGQAVYGEELQFNAVAFIQLWQMGGVLLVVAYEDDTPVGILMGIRSVPIMYIKNVLEIEWWYTRHPEAERGLFDFVMANVKLLDLEEIRVTSDVVGRHTIPWKEANRFTLYRYTDG